MKDARQNQSVPFFFPLIIYIPFYMYIFLLFLLRLLLFVVSLFRFRFDLDGLLFFPSLSSEKTILLLLYSVTPKMELIPRDLSFIGKTVFGSRHAGILAAFFHHPFIQMASLFKTRYRPGKKGKFLRCAADRVVYSGAVSRKMSHFQRARWEE